MLTGDPSYWAPLRPRVKIFDMDDSTYTTALYQYNAFTETGDDDKVIGLRFSTSMTNVGQCEVTIEDSNQEFDVDAFTRGHRITIEGSKDGSTWQTAYHGLIRAVKQDAIGGTGRNVTFIGYNYLVRLAERIIKTNKESTKTGDTYNRTDSTMFTDNLVDNLIDDANNYVWSSGDTALGFIFLKTTNLTSSPVTTWVPKLDVEYGTLASAIDEVLEYSGAVLAVDQATDELSLFDPEQIHTGTNFFMVTNQPNKLADDAAKTLYPLEPYTFETRYDTDDNASRLILPYKSPDSTPAILIDEPETEEVTGTKSSTDLNLFVGNNHERGYRFMADHTGTLGLIRIVVDTLGNNSGFSTSSSHIDFYNDNNTTHEVVEPVIDTVTLYVNSTPGTSYPSSSTQNLILGMAETDSTSEFLVGEEYWMILRNTSSQTDTQTIGWVTESVLPANVTYNNNGGTFTPYTIGTKPRGFLVQPGVPEINLDWLATANDRGAQSRTGRVERTITSIPSHITNLQTIQEYLYPRIYLSSKPRFIFDYPSLTMPNKIPKAGDILCHYDTTFKVGTATTPVQEGVIIDASYDFGQDAEGVTGLRKLSLSTANIKKGYH